MDNDIHELNLSELDAVSGGAPGILAKLASAVCETAGEVAHAVGANVAAYYLYTAAEGLLH